jgi:hypothetical protein
MDNADKIRKLLKQRINAAKRAAKRTNDFMIPLEDRHIVKMSIKEAKLILALLPCETCDDTGQVIPIPDMSFSAYRELSENPIPCPICKGEENG